MTNAIRHFSEIAQLKRKLVQGWKMAYLCEFARAGGKRCR